MAVSRSSAAGLMRAAALLLGLSLLLPSAAAAQGASANEPGLSAEARSRLSEQGFVIVPGDGSDFPELYESLAERDLAVFISADSVLRVTDLLIDRVLRRIEEEYLYDRLEQLSREMVRILENDYLRAQTALVREAARRDLAFFALGLSLLDPDYFPPESVRGLVERELELIEDADRLVISPIMGRTPLDHVVGPGEDYTYYAPTGHYAVSDRLGRYYRALTWYSRMAFALPERPVEDYTLTVQALLIVRALETEAGEWFELWERISYPLEFYYGGAGDPSVADYVELADEVFGRNFDREETATEDNLLEFIDRVSQTAPSHVQTHELRGMRFLPRDFPPATDYFGLLAGSEDRPLPTSLDLMSLLGSPAARALLDENDVFDDSVYRRYYDQIELDLESMTYGEWTSDLYWGWLYCLAELQRPLRENAPAFARSGDWALKQLSTGGAAWAGIRYQAADAALSGPPTWAGMRPATAPVLVEPYPGLYERLSDLLENLRDRLWEHYLLDDTIDAHVSDLITLLGQLESATTHLAGGAASDASLSALAGYSQILKRLAGDVGTRLPGELGCVLVSDVAYEDLDTGRLLQNAVGTPDIIYVRGEDGTVYAGAVHSFFEMELMSRSELESTGWPTVLTSCPVVRPYWVERFVTH